ncbi:MAG: ribonuclease D [Planctomycetota bacterium]
MKSQAELDALCQAARVAGRFGLDVEFIREHTFYPKVALIQVAVGETMALVDPLARLDLTPLDELLPDPSVLKVLHAPTQDLEIFYQRTGRAPAAIFDTQVAAAMLGLGAQVSYSTLIERLLDVTVCKGEAYTDWLRRPLTREQEAYALDDVRYLLPAHDALRAQLDELGRLQWVEEEFQRFSRPDLYEPSPDLAYQRVKRFGTLRPTGLAVLRELAAWRDREARTRDRPRRRIVGDEVLIEIARTAPRTLPELERIRGLHPQLVERSGSAILDQVQRGLATPPAERPQLERRQRLDPDAQLVLSVLDACLRTHCQRAQLDPALVVTSSDLQTLVDDFLCGRVDPVQHRVLSGWRGELVGRDLLDFLEGRASIRIDPATRSPLIERR